MQNQSVLIASQQTLGLILHILKLKRVCFIL